MKKPIIIVLVAGVVMFLVGVIAATYIPLNLPGSKSISVGKKQPKLTNEVDTFSYYYGFNVGQYITKDLDQLKLKKDFPSAKFLNGVVLGIEGEANSINPEKMQAFMQGFFAKKQIEIQEESAKKGISNIEDGRKFLEKNKTEEGVITTESGLQYKVITSGSGISPINSDTVKVHYTGMLLDGKVFDSSVERGEPAEFVVDGVIAGWTEALKLMKTGDKWKLFIPSDLAYGPQQRSEDITPNSTLIFEVELLDVKPAK